MIGPVAQKNVVISYGTKGYREPEKCVTCIPQL